jgi:hypothetical protein
VLGRVAEGAALAVPPVHPNTASIPNDRSAIEVMATRPVTELADTRRTWERPVLTGLINEYHQGV